MQKKLERLYVFNRLEYLSSLSSPTHEQVKEIEMLRSGNYSFKSNEPGSVKKKKIRVVFPNGEEKNFKSIREVTLTLNIHNKTIVKYLDTEIGIGKGKRKGVKFYSVSN